MASPEETYVSVDVEASGPTPGLYSLLAVGACIVGRPDATYYAELQPLPGAGYDPHALAAAGLDPDDLLRRGRPPFEVARDFASWVAAEAGDAPPVFVGFNAAFDWAFVNDLFHRFRVSNPFGHSALDIKSLYMGFAGCAWGDTRSSRLPAEYQPRPSRKHHALDDAVAQAESFARILTAVRGGGEEVLRPLSHSHPRNDV